MRGEWGRTKWGVRRGRSGERGEEEQKVEEKMREGWRSGVEEEEYVVS